LAPRAGGRWRAGCAPTRRYALSTCRSTASRTRASTLSPRPRPALPLLTPQQLYILFKTLKTFILSLEAAALRTPRRAPGASHRAARLRLTGRGAWQALESGSLEALALQQNHAGCRAATRLSAALASGRLLLQRLDLSTNGIGAAGATALGHALASNSVLGTLHLDRNPLGAEGGEGLALGLRSNSLTLLTLASSDLRDGGARALLGALQENKSLTRLDLSTNHFGDVAGTAAAQMLRWNCTLAWLSMQENSVGDAGGAAIGAALQHNSALRSLSLKANSFHDAAGEALVAGMRASTALTEVFPRVAPAVPGVRRRGLSVVLT